MAIISGNPTNGNDVIVADGANDIIDALAGSDRVDGGGGNDALIGNTGNDSLFGNTGNDTLLGNTDNDVLRGGLGSDILDGGEGIDRVTESGDTTIRLNNTSLRVGNETDTLSNIETATLTGGEGNNSISAFEFTLGSVTLNGLGGNDQLRGGTRNDTLNGGVGNDTLKGSQGDDVLIGGVGNDQFLFSTGNAFRFDDLGVDTITNFSVGSDKIVLSKTTFDTLFSGAGGTLNPSEFEVVDSFSEQFSSNAKITYNSVRGNLCFNRNGSVVVGGDAEGNIIADLNPSNTFGGSPNISAADILIVA